MKKSAFIFLVLFFTFLTAQSVDPIYITLNGNITHPDQEISGLAWCSDNLVLLPQYPDNVIYSIPRDQIYEFLDSKRTTITPTEIKWITNEIEQGINGFEGFESIAFAGEQVYVTIEAEHHDGNSGYLAFGKIKGDSIELCKKTLTKINTPVTLQNMTFETIVLSENTVNAIYEVNSEKVNEHPYYYELDRSLKNINKRTFPFVDFRITDATDLDINNRFWAINYFWPGDFKLLNPDIDYKSVDKNEIRPVERLLEFELLDEAIIRTNTQPLTIKLSEFGDSRNWEGVVRLDKIGFLVVTDKFPGSILAFLPYTN